MIAQSILSLCNIWVYAHHQLLYTPTHPQHTHTHTTHTPTTHTHTHTTHAHSEAFLMLSIHHYIKWPILSSGGWSRLLPTSEQGPTTSYAALHTSAHILECVLQQAGKGPLCGGVLERHHLCDRHRTCIRGAAAAFSDHTLT